MSVFEDAKMLMEFRCTIPMPWGRGMDVANERNGNYIRARNMAEAAIKHTGGNESLVDVQIWRPREDDKTFHKYDRGMVFRFHVKDGHATLRAVGRTMT